MIGLGLLLFIVSTLLLALWEQQLFASEWIAPGFEPWIEGFLLPLGRVFCLMLFVATSIPALFGDSGGPSFTRLLQVDGGRFNDLVNGLFFAGLFLPAIPLLRRLGGLILPLQGGVGVAMVFVWYCAAIGVERPSLWPVGGEWLRLIGASALAALFASALSLLVQNALGRQQIYSLLLIWLQLPVLLIYGQLLGARLPA
jgi:hypothetical protein